MIPTDIKRELEESGLQFDVTDGGKHYKLKIEGRLACILPKGGKMRNQQRDRRPILNLRAQVRRLIQEIKDERLPTMQS